MQWSGMAEVETQCLYYAEREIVIDCAELKKRKDLRKK